MWLSDRPGRLVALSVVTAGFLAACGFTPANAPGAGGAILRNQLEVSDPPDENQFFFAQRVEERLGRSVAPVYGLSYSVTYESEELGVSTAGAITRYNLSGTVSYTLNELDTGAIILSDTAQNFTSYSAAGTTIASFANERDARRRLMVLLADQVVTRLQAMPLP